MEFKKYDVDIYDLPILGKIIDEKEKEKIKPWAYCNRAAHQLKFPQIVIDVFPIGTRMIFYYVPDEPGCVFITPCIDGETGNKISNQSNPNQKNTHVGSMSVKHLIDDLCIKPQPPSARGGEQGFNIRDAEFAELKIRGKWRKGLKLNFSEWLEDIVYSTQEEELETEVAA